jgi:hypothetical protein
MKYHTYRILFATNGNAKDGAPVVTSLDVTAIDRHAAEADVLAGFDDIHVVSVMEIR